MAFAPLSLSSPRAGATLSSTNHVTTSSDSTSLVPEGDKHNDLGGGKSITSPHELTQFVDTLLNDLEAKFDTMSSDVIGRLSSLSTRIDSLEASIGEIMAGSSTDGSEEEKKGSGTK